MDALTTAYQVTSAFVESIPKSDRKTYGQFFTPRKTAEFMSSLFTIDYNKSKLEILDAGAGSGVLSIALIQRIRNSGYKGEISLTCYENDVKILPILSENLNFLKQICDIKYTIQIDNYILSQCDQGIFNSERHQYDLIIGNPPYLKISKNADEAKAMPHVCHGAPNLYFLFWAKAIENLKDDCELVYIIPRSWTSGAYFERFRKFLFSHCVITNIHVFGSRDKVFDGESVLQETMIVKMKKTLIKPKQVMMSCSSTSDFLDISHYRVNYDIVVSPKQYVFLVTSDDEAAVLSVINKQRNTLVSDDLQMRTGIIVDFRTREVLRSHEEYGTYPLFYSQHIRNGKIIWPIGHDNEYILTEHPGYLQENGNYLFIKRFTAKEEKRRLQCAIYLYSDYQNYKYISTQNKINYIKCDTPELAYGLYVILNSTLYDDYYRILNGSTQVNSTEINSMPVPSRESIEKMGIELMGKELTEDNCNHILERWIK